MSREGVEREGEREFQAGVGCSTDQATQPPLEHEVLGCILKSGRKKAMKDVIWKAEGITLC